MDRNLALEAVRITEAAALAASRFVGLGDEKAADGAAVEAMHRTLSDLSVAGRIVIGEDVGDGTRLLPGLTLGNGTGPNVDVALDPLEGTTIAAKCGYNALSVVAFGEQGAFLPVPDIYMDKIAVGGDLPDGVIDLDRTPEDNLASVAAAKQVAVSDVMVCILDRPRHEELIGRVRDTGAKVMLISDGDVSGVVATAMQDHRVDMYMGWGGAPQGILAAAALRCLGGQMQGRLVVRSHDDQAEVRRYGLDDPSRKYGLSEMVRGPVMMAVTGVTDGLVAQGVRRIRDHAVTNSLVMRSKTGTLRYITSHHNLRLKQCDS